MAESLNHATSETSEIIERAKELVLQGPNLLLINKVSFLEGSPGGVQDVVHQRFLIIIEIAEGRLLRYNWGFLADDHEVSLNHHAFVAVLFQLRNAGIVDILHRRLERHVKLRTALPM